MTAESRQPGWMDVAVEEARAGLSEDGFPVGAVLVSSAGTLVGRGRNQFAQTGDISAHAEVDAVRDVGNRAGARVYLDDCTLFVTAEPCWLCCGLVHHLRIPEVVVGVAESPHASPGLDAIPLNLTGGVAWLRERGHTVTHLGDPRAEALSSGLGARWLELVERHEAERR